MSPNSDLAPWQHGNDSDHSSGNARWQEYLRQGHGQNHGHGHGRGHAHDHGTKVHGPNDQGPNNHDANHGSNDLGPNGHGAADHGAGAQAPHDAPVPDAHALDAGHPQSPSPGIGSDPAWLHAFDHPGAGSITVMPVDHLTLNNNTLIENHITDTSSIVFNAAPGGDIDVGGNVSALSAQHAEVQSVSSSHGFGTELGWGESAWGDAGGFDAVLVGHLPGHGGAGPIVIMPVDHLTINNNTLVQNFQVENTNVTFNAGTGSNIDVGGNVNALSDQAGHFSQDAHAHDAHALMA